MLSDAVVFASTKPFAGSTASAGDATIDRATSAAIVDASTDGPRERGEIVIRGHNVMRRYFGNPEVNAETFRHGWFRSGDEGFFREMKAGGRSSLRSYGRFVGKRFKDLPNIVWVVGGDYTPKAADQWVVADMAEGIHEEDSTRLMTGHGSPENSAVVAFGDSITDGARSTSDTNRRWPDILAGRL